MFLKILNLNILNFRWYKYSGRGKTNYAYCACTENPAGPESHGSFCRKEAVTRGFGYGRGWHTQRQKFQVGSGQRQRGTEEQRCASKASLEKRKDYNLCADDSPETQESLKDLWKKAPEKIQMDSTIKLFWLSSGVEFVLFRKPGRSNSRTSKVIEDSDVKYIETKKGHRRWENLKTKVRAPLLDSQGEATESAYARGRTAWIANPLQTARYLVDRGFNTAKMRPCRRRTCKLLLSGRLSLAEGRQRSVIAWQRIEWAEELFIITQKIQIQRSFG